MKLYFQYGALIAVLSQIYFAPHENFCGTAFAGIGIAWDYDTR